MEGLTDLKIAVFCGGNSAEREISLSTGQGVHDSLKDRGFRVLMVDLKSEEENQIRHIIYENKIDVVFVAMHGRFGEDGVLQEILEGAGVCYTGSGPQGSLNAFDKVRTRHILKEYFIRQPEFFYLGKEDSRLKPSDFTWAKYVVKPACQGSSIGVHICESPDSYEEALEEVFNIDDTSLVERFIAGRELTVGILGDNALVPIGIVPRQSSHFDFSSKYTKGATVYDVPARVSKEISLKAQEAALSTHRALGLEDFSRVDMIASNEGEIFVLEANSIPGLTPTSLLPKAALFAGIDYSSLCLLMIKMAVHKKYAKKVS